MNYIYMFLPFFLVGTIILVTFKLVNWYSLKAIDKDFVTFNADTGDFFIPAIGSDEITVEKVLISENDQVAEGQAMLILDYWAATLEVPSPVSGKVKSLLVGQGQKVRSKQLAVNFYT